MNDRRWQELVETGPNWLANEIGSMDEQEYRDVQTRLVRSLASKLGAEVLDRSDTEGLEFSLYFRGQKIGLVIHDDGELRWWVNQSEKHTCKNFTHLFNSIKKHVK